MTAALVNSSRATPLFHHLRCVADRARPCSDFACVVHGERHRRAYAARRRKRPFVAEGIDVRATFEAYKKAPVFAGRVKRRTKLEVKHRSGEGTSGQGGAKLVRLTVGYDSDEAEVLVTLVHEMVHACLPANVYHGERFRLTYARAARELWGMELPLDAEPDRGKIAYGMDAVAEKRIREWQRSGLTLEAFGAVLASYEEAGAPAPKRAPRVPLVEKRAAHAARMLARAEKRLTNAERTAAKWRAKVRYYERATARKRGPS